MKENENDIRRYKADDIDRKTYLLLIAMVIAGLAFLWFTNRGCNSSGISDSGTICLGQIMPTTASK